MGKHLQKPHSGGFNPDRSDKGYGRRPDRPGYHDGRQNRPPESDAERDDRIQERRKQEAILDKALATGDRETIASAVNDVSIGVAVSTMRHALHELVDSCETKTGVVSLAQAIDGDNRRDDRTRERAFSAELVIAEFYREIQLNNDVSWDVLFEAVGFNKKDGNGDVVGYGWDIKPQALRAAPGKLRKYAAAHPDEGNPDLSPDLLEATAQLFDAFITERDEKARKASAADPGFSRQDRYAARLARVKAMAAQREAERPVQTTSRGPEGPTSMAQALAEAGASPMRSSTRLLRPDDTATEAPAPGTPVTEDELAAAKLEAQIPDPEDAERALAEAKQDADIAATQA